MDSPRLPKIMIPMVRTKKIQPNEELYQALRLREQEESSNTVVSYWTIYTKNAEHERKMRQRAVSTANCNEVTGKDKHDKQFKKPLSCKKEQKPIIQDLKKKEVAKDTLEENIFSKEMAMRETNEDFPSISVFQHQREMRLPEKVLSQQDCKKIVYDNLDKIKRKEAANYILLENKRCAERANRQLLQKLQEEQERKQKDEMKQSLTDTWDAQIQYKQQKEEKRAKIERQYRAAMMESDRLHQTEEIETRRRKKEQCRKFLRQNETLRTKEKKKSSDYSLEDVLKKCDGLLQEKHCDMFSEDETATLSHKIQHQQKTPKQNPLADELAARHKRKEKKKREMDRTERQGVLPGYRGEESRQKAAAQQNLKTQNNVTEPGRAVHYQSVVLDRDSHCDIADNNSSLEIRKRIVYDQLSLIKKKEDMKRTFMEEKLMEDIKHREAAEQKLEKLEKEKKAAANMCLIDSWGSQIRRKQQEKKKLREAERRDMLSLIELDRVCGGESSRKISHQECKQPVQGTLPAARPGRSSSKSCAGKTSNACRSSLSRQKVSSTTPVRLPSLDSSSMHLPEDCQETENNIVKLPSIPIQNE